MTDETDARPGPKDGAGYVVLDRQQCLQRLALGGLGRVAVNVGALPAIFPVHFVLHGDEVAFSVGAGTTLDRATRDAVVAFESDGQEPAAGGHWSVAITGMARHLSEGDNSERAVLERLPGGWDPSERRRVVRVSTEFMSGRRSG